MQSLSSQASLSFATELESRNCSHTEISCAFQTYTLEPSKLQNTKHSLKQMPLHSPCGSENPYSQTYKSLESKNHCPQNNCWNDLWLEAIHQFCTVIFLLSTLLSIWHTGLERLQFPIFQKKTQQLPFSAHFVPKRSQLLHANSSTIPRLFLQ